MQANVFDSMLEVFSLLGRELFGPSDTRALLGNIVEGLKKGFSAQAVGVVVPDTESLGADPCVAATGDLRIEEVVNAVRLAGESSDPSAPMQMPRQGEDNGGAGRRDGKGRLWVQLFRAGVGFNGGLVVALPEAITPRDPTAGMVSVAAKMIAQWFELRRGLGSAHEAGLWTSRVLENMPDPALLLRRSGEILEVSATAGRLIGGSRNELIGRNFLDFVDDHGRGQVGRELQEAEGSATVGVGFGLRSDDGRLRRLHLRGRQVQGDLWLVVLHDHARFAARDRNRRIMLDRMPQMAAAEQANEVWAILWQAIREMLPGAVEARIYRGDAAAVRLEWASDPRRRGMDLTLRGWGTNFLRMMQEPRAVEAFSQMFGESREEAIGRLQRFFTGQGNPLLLNEPNEQLAVFLGQDDMEKIVASRTHGEAPGQEIICPILAGDHIDTVAVILAPPEKKPFSWDDAADVWQLVLLAREVLIRLETRATVERHLDEVQAMQSMLRQVNLATEEGELFTAVGQVALKAMDAPYGLIASFGVPGVRSASIDWSAGLDSAREKAFADILELVVRKRLKRGSTVLIESFGADEAFATRDPEIGGLEALAAVPLEVRGTVLGVLGLAWPLPRRFTIDEMGLLEFIGAELSLSLMNHSLFQRVADAKAELAEIVRAVDEGILSLDAEGRVRYCNPRALGLLGMVVPETTGRPLLDVVGPAVRSAIGTLLGPVLSGRGTRQEVVDLGGRIVRTKIVTLGEDGQPFGSVWTLSDVTEEVARDLRFRQLLLHASDWILVMDADGVVLEANAAAGSLGLESLDLGSREGEAGEVRQRWPEINPPILEELRAEGSVRTAGRIEGREGRIVPYEADLWMIREGSEERIVAIVRDLTQHERMLTVTRELKEARHAEERLSDFTRELRAALTAQEDLITSLLTHSELALASGDPERMSTTLSLLKQVGDRGRLELAHLGQVAEDISGVLTAELERRTLAQEMERSVVWIVSDRPQNRALILKELDREGFKGVTIPPEEIPQAFEYGSPVKFLVLALVSLTNAEDVYRRLRRVNPGLPILMISPIGGVAGERSMSEDNLLWVMESFPTGRSLENFLKAVH